MSLARVWTRQLYGASGAALLAPATMIAALAVLVLGGGFGGLGALGQLLSGPAVPVGLQVPGGGAAHRAGSRVLPVVPASVARPRVTAPPRAARPTIRGGGSPGSFVSTRVQRAQHITSGGRGSSAVPPAPTSTTPSAPPPAQPPTLGPAPPSLVNQVLGAGEAVTSKLPGPLGTLGTGALQSLGQTLNKLLPSS